jgi:hypothetical protein
VAIDAMVGLAILSAVVILSFGAFRVASKVSAAALETRKADTELRYLLGIPLMTGGAAKGLDAIFEWQVRVSAEPVARPDGPRLCERHAQARSRATGRLYTLSRAEICGA